MDKYQRDYAAGRPQMYELASRKEKAMRIIKLLNNYYGKNKLSNLTVLDVGASTGIIDNELARAFKKIVGIDIDKNAIKHAKNKFKKKNLLFKIDDAMNLSFKPNTFDLVICSQVYEHVPDSQKLIHEIYRVLKPKGVCYFAALNKLFPLEPHYNLLFLSWLPKKFGNYYLRIFGKANVYHETLKTYWELKRMTKKFNIIDYTPKILNDPKLFGFNNLAKLPINLTTKLISPLSKFITPTFFWLLIKEK